MDWIDVTWPQLGKSLFALVVVYAAIILYTRIVGLRSFSKMSAPDFAMTVAVGSLFATATTANAPPLILSLVCMAGLFAAQWIVAFLRHRSDPFSKAIDNEPLLLMKDGEFLEENLRRSNVTKNDLIGKLREANAYRLESVHAVVFEVTGDISVLHGDEGHCPVDDSIMANVVGWEKSS